MGYWALEQACPSTDSKWEQPGISPFIQLLSTYLHYSLKIKTCLRTALEQYQIQPHNLILEITESTANASY